MSIARTSRRAGLWIAALIVASGARPGTAAATELPIQGSVINIVSWDSEDLPPVYERSDQLPLSAEDILRLSQSGFAPEALSRMVQERRFVGDASADGLISLRNRGVNPAVLQAVSLHALPPNRSLSVALHLQFEGTSTQARRRYLYVIIPDGDAERVLTADLAAVLGRSFATEIVDHSDPVLPRTVRQAVYAGRVPLKAYGPREGLVFTSARPDIVSATDISTQDRARASAFVIDYPASSLTQRCDIWVRYRQNPALPTEWNMVRAHGQCEWN